MNFIFDLRKSPSNGHGVDFNAFAFDAPVK